MECITKLRPQPPRYPEESLGLPPPPIINTLDTSAKYQYPISKGITPAPGRINLRSLIKSKTEIHTRRVLYLPGVARAWFISPRLGQQGSPFTGTSFSPLTFLTHLRTPIVRHHLISITRARNELGIRLFGRKGYGKVLLSLSLFLVRLWCRPVFVVTSPTPSSYYLSRPGQC